MRAVALYLLGVLLAGGGAQADSDHDRVKRLRDAGHILPLESIVASSRRDYNKDRYKYCFHQNLVV